MNHFVVCNLQHKQDSIWLPSCWNFYLLNLRSSTSYQFKLYTSKTFTHHRSKTCPLQTIILHKNKEMPAFPSGAPQKLTNLAPNIPCTRLPMCKFGTCAQVVRRGWLWWNYNTYFMLDIHGWSPLLSLFTNFRCQCVFVQYIFYIGYKLYKSIDTRDPECTYVQRIIESICFSSSQLLLNLKAWNPITR